MEHQKYLDDVEIMPEEKEFVYKGIKAKISRNPMLGTLCGYFDLEALELTHEQHEELEKSVHRGFTGGSGTLIGFDCAHCTDFIPNLAIQPSGITQTYKDSIWVEKHIKELIDIAFELKI